ncbi:hypothetical protein [Halorubrum sp. DTA46]|uniref:hypothetical protein n=1 Tax=Halorubrum sp. DTA46 TaxID=3402162 RepID=UPI003AABF510
MSDDGPGAREVAHRVFAAEFDDASLSYSESDEERAPNYVVTPTGARINRLFVAGVLTEVERVNDETRRGRVVDPSGAFVTYAGQYQPEAQAFLERAEPPAFVALTGKARTFEPEDSDRVFTSVRPESLNEVDADTRDRWVVSAAEATLDRLAVFAQALDSDLRGDDLRAALEAGGAPAALAAGIPKAIAHYDTSTAYVEAVRRLAVDALELIAGDRDEVRVPDISPAEGGETSIGALPETDVTIAAAAASPSDSSTESESLTEPESSDSSTESESLTEPESSGDEEAAESDSTDVTAADDVDSPTGSADAEPSSDSDATLGTSSDVGEAEDEPAGDAESGSEADADPIPDTTGDDGGLGDFDAGSDETDTSEPALDDAAADTDEMYELDDDEREEIESEFGTDFATGSEVDEPGEADIDVPDPEELSETPADADPEGLGDADAQGSDDSAVEHAASGDDADAEDLDLEAAAVDAMGALDDGDGADREAVVEHVVSEHGVDAAAVEDAIQDALMGGKCYEPGDGVLKPI